MLLVSQDRSAAESGSTGSVLTALAAGAGFGGFFILLALAPDGRRPLAAGRRAAVLGRAGGRCSPWRRGAALRPGTGSLHIIVAAGVLDMVANVLYLLAKQQGLLSLVAVLVSLYPASTLLLARQVLGERLHAIQVAGVGFALGAVALIAAA